MLTQNSFKILPATFKDNTCKKKLVKHTKTSKGSFK